MVPAGARDRARQRQCEHGPRHRLLLHEPAGQALQQFDRSLAIDARHTKTLLNVGIVRAFGKDDLAGRGRGLAARRRVSRRTRRRASARSRRSTACATRIPTCREARARPRNLRAPRIRHYRQHRRSRAMLRILQFLLILAVVRAVWRLGKGVLEGAGYRRVDGPREGGREARARSGLRHVRVVPPKRRRCASAAKRSTSAPTTAAAVGAPMRPAGLASVVHG